MPRSWKVYSHFTDGKTEAEELIKVTRGEVKLKAEGKTKCCFAQLAPIFHGCQLQKWDLASTPTTHQQYLSSSCPFSDQISFLDFLLVTNTYFSLAKDIVIWCGFVRKETGGCKADFGEICRAVGIREGERAPSWDVRMLLS